MAKSYDMGFKVLDTEVPSIYEIFKYPQFLHCVIAVYWLVASTLRLSTKNVRVEIYARVKDASKLLHDN